MLLYLFLDVVISLLEHIMSHSDTYALSSKRLICCCLLNIYRRLISKVVFNKERGAYLIQLLLQFTLSDHDCIISTLIKWVTQMLNQVIQSYNDLIFKVMPVFILWVHSSLIVLQTACSHEDVIHEASDRLFTSSGLFLALYSLYSLWEPSHSSIDVTKMSFDNDIVLICKILNCICINSWKICYEPVKDSCKLSVLMWSW